MATPLLVRTYDSGMPSPMSTPQRQTCSRTTLPPISSFTFAEILRSADNAEFQSAITGIAEICAKNRMSLADEYSSHLPPQGEITAASRPQLPRPGMRRALTSVPEASSSSSEGSARSGKRKGGLFFLPRRQNVDAGPMRTMRIGSMGRDVRVDSTTAYTDASVSRVDSRGSRSSGPSESQQGRDEACRLLRRVLASDAGPT